MAVLRSVESMQFVASDQVGRSSQTGEWPVFSAIRNANPMIGLIAAIISSAMVGANRG